MKRTLVIAGTRPEGIKLAPVIRALAARPGDFEVRLCVTGQHRDMLHPVLEFFGLAPDFDLGLMQPGQDLFDVTASAVLSLRPVLSEVKPELVVVQGDTTTALAGALAGYYAGAQVAHVEAGLRTGQRRAPFPEEMNRVLISRLADFHFAPTPAAQANLHAEGLTTQVHVVGNTVIDALLWAQSLVTTQSSQTIAARFAFLAPTRRMVLVTGHRRESFGAPFERICRALRTLAETFPQVDFVYPVHLNPHVREPVERLLSSVPSIHLVEPVDYPTLVWLLSRCTFVITDSGGIQEEAPTLGKPVLVTREVTERPEGIAAGSAKLVGTDEQRIVLEASKLLNDASAYEAMARVRNPYGDGKASEAIAQVLATAERR